MKRSLTIILFTAALTSPVSAQRVYTLGECRQMALQNNIKMRDAQLNIHQAEETEKYAFSKYLPNVIAGATYFHANDYLVKKTYSLSPELTSIVSSFNDFISLLSCLGLNPLGLATLPTSVDIRLGKQATIGHVIALEPIYAGGQITAGNKLARLQTDVRKLQKEQSSNEVITNTDSYYNLLLSLYIKRQTVKAANQQLTRIHQDAENAYKGGVIDKNDLLTVEVKQNEVGADSLKLENGIQLTKMALAQYIGMNALDIEIDTSITTSLPLPTVYAVDHDAALENRIETKLLDKNVEANHLQVKMKRGATLPTLSVGGVGLYQDWMGKGQTNIIGVATLSVPISELWGSTHEVKRQKIAEQVARQDREDNRQLLILQMKSAYNNLDNAYKRIVLARKNIEKSEENLRLNEDYYQAGTSTMSDLLDAQTKNQQARDQYADAVSDYLNCRTVYLLATGRDVE